MVRLLSRPFLPHRKPPINGLEHFPAPTRRFFMYVDIAGNRAMFTPLHSFRWFDRKFRSIRLVCWRRRRWRQSRKNTVTPKTISNLSLRWGSCHIVCASFRSTRQQRKKEKRSMASTQCVWVHAQREVLRFSRCPVRHATQFRSRK